MGRTCSVEFTSSDSWTCPVGVTAVFLLECGGGSGAAAHLCGGGGGGELVIGRPITVIPEHVYTVTVGSGGVGTNSATAPTHGTSSSFAGYTTLGAGQFQSTFGPDNQFAPENSGSGGGAGGGIGASAGGGSSQAVPLRECRHFSGGGIGSTGLAFWDRPNLTGPTTGGGDFGLPGDASEGVNTGGAGGGTLWGSPSGGLADGGLGISFDMDAGPTQYGAGAGGNGDNSGSNQQGGNGKGGKVVLMWVGPQT